MKYGHFMDTFMYTFLREMHTMDTLQVYRPLVIKNTNYASSTYMYIRKVCKVSISRCKVYMNLYIKCPLNYGGFS